MGIELVVGESRSEIIEVHPTAPSPPGPRGIQGPPGDPTAYDLRGTGFPTMAASVGTRYVDTAATNGAVEWIRAANGWQVSFGDTGWRALTTDLGSGVAPINAATTPRVRRVGSTVYLTGNFTASSVAAGSVVLTFPMGFRADGYTYSAFANSSSAAILARLETQPDGTTRTSAALNGNVSLPNLTVFTVQQWPSTLPGTAA